MRTLDPQKTGGRGAARALYLVSLDFFWVLRCRTCEAFCKVGNSPLCKTFQRGHGISVKHWIPISTQTNLLYSIRSEHGIPISI